jgi:hypothetical protein
MLPNSTSGASRQRRLHQRQHRRQNSTPVDPRQPTGLQKRPVVANTHRRGISLDIRPDQLWMMAPDQLNSITTTDTNTAGLAANPQHGLREAQQHSQQASPGPAGHHPASYTNLPNSFSHDSFMTDNTWNLANAQAFLDNSQLDPFQPDLAQWQQSSGQPRTPRRVSNGIADQVLKFEQLGKQNEQPGRQTPNQDQIGESKLHTRQWPLY